MKVLYPSKKASSLKAALFVLAAFVTSLAGNKVQAQGYVRNGLQIYYPFDGNANDFSGQSNTGIPVNLDFGPDRFGRDSGAGFFNGISTIVMSSFPADVNVNFAVAGWAKSNALPSPSRLESIVGIEDAGDLYFNAGISGIDSTFGFIFKSAGVYQPYSKSRIDSLALGWFHFCVVRSGGLQTQYINGIPGDTQVVAAGFVDGTTNPILVGGSPFVRVLGRGGYFNGLLDEIRVYNRSLNQTEIDTLAGRVTIAVNKKLPHGSSITRTDENQAQVYSSVAIAEVSVFDLKGIRLFASRDIPAGQRFSFKAPQAVLIQVLDKQGNRYAQFLP